MFATLLKQLPALGRTKKRAILVVYDVAAMAVALWGAFSVRLGLFFNPNDPVLLVSAITSFVVGITALYGLGIYHIVLRYFDMRTVVRIFAAAAVAAISWVVVVYFTGVKFTVAGMPTMVPRSVGFIYFGFLFLLLFMGRYNMALLLSQAARLPPPSPHSRFNIIIYGANTAGISLANSMRMAPQYRLVAFVDDDPALAGQIICGLPIYAPDALAEIVEQERVNEVFLALPRSSRAERLAAINRVGELNLTAKTVPAPEEIVSGRFSVSDIRPIDVSDLLRRDPVEPIHQLLYEAVEKQSILITGAGGSIGSEICRQAVQARPRRLVLLDHSEFALYSIDQALGEMLDKLPYDHRPEIVTIVGSVLNGSLLQNLIRNYGIDSVYHAAAYKHVPLLERNEVAAVENNVIGTLVLVRAAVAARVTRFTMVSTDKAVRPKSVMGATKRVAELVVQAFAKQSDCRTKFGIVRFGNVLDSSGSVVQRFRRQIRQGGPVTVTHPDVTRYFMSIPEATQLVLQASAMANDCEVFVLDMGEPVRIADLARNMIMLSGMSIRDQANPAGDIEIDYVGLRPGEKLYEELFLGEDAVDTEHPRIRMANERCLTLDELLPHLNELRQAIADERAHSVRRKLQEVITADRMVSTLREGTIVPLNRNRLSE